MEISAGRRKIPAQIEIYDNLLLIFWFVKGNFCEKQCRSY